MIKGPCNSSYPFVILIMSIPFSWRLHHFLHVPFMEFSVFFDIFLLPPFPAWSVVRLTSIHCRTGGFISHSNSEFCSLFLMKSSCLLLLCLAFEKHFSLIRCVFGFQCRIVLKKKRIKRWLFRGEVSFCIKADNSFQSYRHLPYFKIVSKLIPLIEVNFLTTLKQKNFVWILHITKK